MFFTFLLQPFYGVAALIRWFFSNLLMWVSDLSSSFTSLTPVNISYLHLYIWINFINKVSLLRFLLDFNLCGLWHSDYFVDGETVEIPQRRNITA